MKKEKEEREKYIRWPKQLIENPENIWWKDELSNKYKTNMLKHQFNTNNNLYLIRITIINKKCYDY